MNSFEQKTFKIMLKEFNFKRIMVNRHNTRGKIRFNYFAFFEKNNITYGIYDVFSKDIEEKSFSFNDLYDEIKLCQDFINTKISKIFNNKISDRKKLEDELYYFLDDQLSFFHSIAKECIDEGFVQPEEHEDVELREIVKQLMDNDIRPLSIYQNVMDFYGHDRKKIKKANFKEKWVEIKENGTKITQEQKRSFG